jgi:hypothetical protein
MHDQRVPVTEIPDFRKGRQVRGGRPAPTEPFRVTVVTRDAIDEFLGTTTPCERASHLRGLRDLGFLVHKDGRLTQRVQTPSGRVAHYVLRGRAADVPRRRRRPQTGRITTW